MSRYRCYFLNSAGSTTAWQTFDCTSDAEAKNRATELLAARPQDHSVDVWETDRCVFHHARAAATQV